MTSELLLEYEKTRYLVLTDDGEIVAEALIGQSSAPVDELLADHGAVSGAFITAWNPRSEVTDETQNRQAHDRLRDELAAAGFVALPHRGVGADSAWEPEEGFLAIGMAEAEAVQLAEAFGQNAIVMVERGEAARLVLTDVLLDAPPAVD